MENLEKGYLLRIFISESESYNHRPAYEAIVLKARETGLRGATVTRGVLGYGSDRALHSAKILHLSEDLPLIIEIADTAEKIENFLPFVKTAAAEGLVTVEEISIVKYSDKK